MHGMPARSVGFRVKYVIPSIEWFNGMTKHLLNNKFLAYFMFQNKDIEHLNKRIFIGKARFLDLNFVKLTSAQSFGRRTVRDRATF